MKVIIFGSNGQDGFYLRLLLEKLGYKVFSVSRSNSDILGDVKDLYFVSNLIQKLKPNYIFSFAANSTTNHDVLFENHQTITSGTLNILESVRLHCIQCKVFLSGSALQFKNTGIAINENTPFEASSQYSLARINSVYASRYFRDRFSMKIYVGYFFNHDSPLRSERHVNQYIVSTAFRIAKGSNEKLEIGDISVRKEFAFAGDIVEGIWNLVNQETIFEAVIGSGIDYSIQDWIEICFSYFNLNWKKHFIQNFNFKSEYKLLVSDPSLINSLGWNSKTDINSLADLMIRKSKYIG